MKNFNLDRTIIAFSDDERYAVIRAADYFTDIHRSFTFSWTIDEMGKKIDVALSRCQDKHIDQTYALSKQDLETREGRLMVVFVLTHELRTKAPNYFMPSDAEMLLDLAQAQREDRPFSYPQWIDYAKNLWSEQVAMRVDRTPLHNAARDLGPNIYCEKDVLPDPEPLFKDASGLKPLKERIRNAPAHIDNSSLKAGSPMYFYCKLCMGIAEVLPEDYTKKPKQYCDPCQELKDVNPGVTDETFLEHAAEA